MKVYKALFAIIMASASLMSAGAITRAELKKFPVHYTTVPYGEMFTKLFEQDTKGRYTVKGKSLCCWSSTSKDAGLVSQPDFSELDG